MSDTMSTIVHVAKVVSYESPADGLVVIHAECCGDKSTHSQHTTADLDNIETEVSNHLARVSSLHAKKLKAIAIVEKLMQQTAIAPSQTTAK